MIIGGDLWGSWAMIGRFVGDPGENVGRLLGDSLEILGDPWEILGRLLGDSWDSLVRFLGDPRDISWGFSGGVGVGWGGGIGRVLLGPYPGRDLP